MKSQNSKTDALTQAKLVIIRNAQHDVFAEEIKCLSRGEVIPKASLGLTSYLQDQGSTWTFNPPLSSHMSGVWEHIIGVAHRILDALLLKTQTLHLTHEVLVTLMSKVIAIMNARPLVSVSSDSDMPTVLTPAMLLTQKIDPGEAQPQRPLQQAVEAGPGSGRCILETLASKILGVTSNKAKTAHRQAKLV